jgi:hypothetical protein
MGKVAFLSVVAGSAFELMSTSASLHNSGRVTNVILA